MRWPIRHLTAIVLASVVLAMPRSGPAQTLPASEREALVALHSARGGRAEEVDVLIRVADETAAKRLPVFPIVNKIREGLAKGVAVPRIEAVIRTMAGELAAADGLLREMAPLAGRADHGPAVALLAESIGAGVSPGEILELWSRIRTSGAQVAAAEIVAGAVRGLSYIKEARLPASDGTAVMVEAVRHDFRLFELLDLGREVKRREADYQAGRASLRELGDAIARGERPDQVRRDTRPETVERPAAARPDAAPDRPTRPERPEVPQRPERPGL